MRNPNGHPFVAALLDPVMRPLEPLRDHVVPLATGRVLEVGVGTGLNLARYDPEALRQAVLEGDALRALRLLRTLMAEGCAAPLIVWAIASALRLIALARHP